MTIGAGRGDMCTREREYGCTVIKASFFTSCRMALITGHTDIGISPDTCMSVVHISQVMRVTVDTTESLKTRGIAMTIGATAPCSHVFSGINRKVLCVMDPVFGGFPSGSGGMTIAAC